LLLPLLRNAPLCLPITAGHNLILLLGYNFPSLATIAPHLEPTASGPTAIWAALTASRLRCLVTVGYPEITSNPENYPRTVALSPDGALGGRLPSLDPTSTVRTYNSTMTVAPDGTLLAHYRKTHLYYTDATWAYPSPTGFMTTGLPLQLLDNEHTTMAAFAICMDFNDARFDPESEKSALAMHVLHSGAQILIASMAWLTSYDCAYLTQNPKEPDPETWKHWVRTLMPLYAAGTDGRRENVKENVARQPSNRDGGRGSKGDDDEDEAERIVIIANRCGVEPGPLRVVDLNRNLPLDLLTENERWRQNVGVESPNSVGSEPSPVAPAADVSDEQVSDLGITAPGARYAGSSCVLKMKHPWDVRICGIMGRLQEGLLKVDTGVQGNRVEFGVV